MTSETKCEMMLSSDVEKADGRQVSPTSSATQADSPADYRDKIKAEDLDDLEAVARAESVPVEFVAKVRVLNAALQECGMGRYQWQLFISAGFGWFSDNIWLQGIAIIMPAVANETGWRNYPDVRLATLALYVGLFIGALFWGISCDLIGRKPAWNATIVVAAVFGICAGAAPNFIVFCTFIALIGFGAGGNLPVDGALFLEFLPKSHDYLLTLLSAWWAIGQVMASLICWVFIAHFSCDTALLRDGATPQAGYTCNWDTNAGWRYSYFTLGALMLALAGLRVFVLPLHESPKWLLAMGRDEAAVRVIHDVARTNGVTSSLTLETLQAAAARYNIDGSDLGDTATHFTMWQLIKMSTSNMRGEHIRALFRGKRLAWNTSLIIFIYGALGLGYPLYNAFLGGFLQSKAADTGDTSVDGTYSTYAYQAACGVIGSLLASWLVMQRIGRKGAMSFCTLASGVFLFGLTATRTAVQTNVLTCFASLFQNGMYGVLYSLAPEVFPTPHRGTGDALAATASRVTGLFAPIIAVYSPAADSPSGPVYVSAGIFIGTGLVMLLLPVETRGRIVY